MRKDKKKQGREVWTEVRGDKEGAAPLEARADVDVVLEREKRGNVLHDGAANIYNVEEIFQLLCEKDSLRLLVV